MPSPGAEPLSLPRLLWRLGAGLFTLLVAVAALGVLLRGPIEVVAAWFVSHLGLAGVFVMVLLTDTVPLTHEPVLLLGYSGGLGFVPVWLAASAGSVLAGVVGWLLGRVLGRHPAVRRKLARYRIDAFLLRYGAGAVAVAALTPFPFSVATWASGAARLGFWPLLLGSLVRVPKVLIYLSLIALGWGAAG